MTLAVMTRASLGHGRAAAACDKPDHGTLCCTDRRRAGTVCRQGFSEQTWLLTNVARGSRPSQALAVIYWPILARLKTAPALPDAG